MRRLGQQLKNMGQHIAESLRQAFRGRINLVNSQDNIQKVQLSALADETLQDVEFIQHFGLTSVPPANSQAIILPLGGETSHSVVIATEHGSFRLKALQEGEVAIYDQSGSSVILKQGKLIEMHCENLIINASQKVQINSPLVETSQVLTAQGQINGNGGMAIQGGNGATFNGNISQSSGDYKTTGDVVANGKSLVNHKHKEQGDGQPTSAPL
ncbi:phage baseplate assembly protein V [Volucribacter amazonae]|uniref:Baseplate assembly protein n=1 Tax=Volucribacter amazonae TaxID=256731 RepID=A0A9X4SKD8_9PAST|nr:phage baseplate assembly protein V [Volucribacter amazonae]MDG6895034.1 baseplate assembly protein [Volucribacter amazonae]